MGDAKAGWRRACTNGALCHRNEHMAPSSRGGTLLMLSRLSLQGKKKKKERISLTGDMDLPLIPYVEAWLFGNAGAPHFH